LDHFLLPFFENWPAPMTGYKWNDLPFEQHWKKAGPIEAGFSEQYCDEWRALLADFQKHIMEKGWNRTAWQVVLNKKYFYKQYRLQNGKPIVGGGTSFWLCDEPHTIDDFRALEFFGRLFKTFSPNRAPLEFRTDVSRPQYQRDVLAPDVDQYISSNGM